MRVIRFIIAIAALALPCPAWAQHHVGGAEFRINFTGTGNQFDPSVASDSAGNFVVVWSSDGQDGSGLGVFGRRFTRNGVELGSEFRVNLATAGSQENPSVAMDGTGGFVVVWQSADAYGTGIFGRGFDSTGAPWSGEFPINTWTTYDQFGPRIAMNRSGEFVVTWSSTGQDGSGFGVIGKRFDSLGAQLGGEFQVNTWTTTWQSEGAVSMNESGEFVVAWRSWWQDGSSYAVMGQRFDSRGLPRGSELQLNVFTLGNQLSPAVGMDDEGGFLALWQSTGQDGSGDGVCVRQFDSTGQGSVEYMVNDHTAGGQGRPAVSLDSYDNFLVVWESGGGQDGAGMGVFGQAWEDPGPEFQINSWTTGDQLDPAVSVSESGDIIVVWTSNGQDGSGSGIYGRLYRCDDTDADGLCDFADVIVVVPSDGVSLDCSDPRTTRPTIVWEPGNYDRFRVFLSADPAFSSKSAWVTSGDSMLKGTSWMPSTKKWRSACRKALEADPFSPGLFIIVQGLDRGMPKSDPARRTWSQVVETDIDL